MEKNLPTQYQQFIHLSRYSRWLPNESRRETWSETVKRYFDFFETHLQEMHNYSISKKMREELENAVLDLKVMPSMRCLMTAGEALKKRISQDIIVLMLRLIDHRRLMKYYIF